MIADEVEEFLKFFDNVGYQLACLLDIDGQNGAKKSYNRQKVSLISKTRTAKHKANTTNTTTEFPTNGIKRAQTKNQQSTKSAKRKRRDKVAEGGVIASAPSDHQTHDNNQHSDTIINNESDAILIQPACEIQLHNNKQQLQPTPPDSHPLDGSLTLGIVDELQHLDHGSSISPMDQSIQFTTPILQQHYYPSQRGHIDSYQLHDEFTGHESIPITNSGSHINQDQQSRLNHQHLVSHPQQANDGAVPTLASSDCYPNHHMHQQQPHHHQHHHHNHNHNLHVHQQYHQLDQQWLSSTTHSTDATLQMATTDNGPLDHAVPLSPITHQTLEQVQFSTPLYHHGYYNHQTEHLDSFQHINDDYTTNTDPLTGNSSSTLESLHRLSQDSQVPPPQQQQSEHLHQPSQIRMSINGGNSGNEAYESHHHHHQHSQQQQQQSHHHHQHQHTHSQVHHAQPEHQMQNIDSSYGSHHNHHHQHSQHQMMPLMNSLEPSGVIIQDINLASATWSSPEDLYSI